MPLYGADTDVTDSAGEMIARLRSRGLISVRAAAKQLGEGYRLDSTSIDGQRLSRDDGTGRGRGAIRSTHLNDDAQQGGSATYGRKVSSSGGAGPERQVSHRHIDEERNSRRDVSSAQLSDRNRLMNDFMAKHPSARRARASSANEYYANQTWLSGDPASRQSGPEPTLRWDLSALRGR